jgi:hypothetical protein
MPPACLFGFCLGLDFKRRRFSPRSHKNESNDIPWNSKCPEMHAEMQSKTIPDDQVDVKMCIIKNIQNFLPPPCHLAFGGSAVSRRAYNHIQSWLYEYHRTEKRSANTRGIDLARLPSALGWAPRIPIALREVCS